MPQSDVLKMALEMAEDLHEVGAVDDATMEKLRTICHTGEAPHE
jgi:hypothetical protein